MLKPHTLVGIFLSVSTYGSFHLGHHWNPTATNKTQMKATNKTKENH